MACCWITSWLQAKLNATGIAALEREFDHGSASAELQRLRRVLRNASHVLAAQPELAARAPPSPPAFWPPRPCCAPLLDIETT
jgi:hypothetical protein